MTSLPNKPESFASPNHGGADEAAPNADAESAIEDEGEPEGEAEGADGEGEAEGELTDAAGDGSASSADAPPHKRRRRGRRRRRGGAADDAPASAAQPAASPAPSPRPATPAETLVRVTGIVDLPTSGGKVTTGDGRLRQLADGLLESPNDPTIPAELIQRLGLRQNAKIVAEALPAGAAKDSTKDAAKSSPRATVRTVLEAEGLSLEFLQTRKAFADLTPLDPAPRMTLEHRGCPPACRLIDLFCPIGFGTRGLIVAPPKAGKTVLLQNIAFGIKQNHPQVELVALLIDERPEEVTDFKRNVPAHVLASSNDQDLDRHLSLGILAIERAKRLVEAGKDVVVLLDSLTRLGRAFNNSRKYGSSGRTMSGGLDSRALEVPKQLFGAARRAEEGGSLTIIATCLVDTGSRADQIIFEEFKGTGNMELILDREIADKRIFPAINLAASGTRKEHLLLSEQALKTITALRRRLLSVPPHVQIEQLLGALTRFETNDRLVAG
jgi:transcription termination factor Rho